MIILKKKQNKKQQKKKTVKNMKHVKIVGLNNHEFADRSLQLAP